MSDLDDQFLHNDKIPLLDVGNTSDTHETEGLGAREAGKLQSNFSTLRQELGSSQPMEGALSGLDRLASSYVWRDNELAALQQTREWSHSQSSKRRSTDHISPCIELSSTGILHVHAQAKLGGHATPLQSRSSQTLDTTMGAQDPIVLDVDDEDSSVPQPGTMHHKPVNWRPFCAVALTLIALILGAILLFLAPKRRWAFLEMWRWCFFIAGMAPNWYICSLAIHLILIALEAKFFTLHQAVYLAVALKGPATMLLRMLLLIPLFMLAFADEIERPEEVQVAYSAVLKILACLVLFAGGNVLKTLLAKLLASNFHRKAFFDKMQDALQKEYFLHALSQPRKHGPLHAAALANPSSAERQSVKAEMLIRQSQCGSYGPRKMSTPFGKARSFLNRSSFKETKDPGKEHSCGPNDGSSGIPSCTSEGYSMRPDNFWPASQAYEKMPPLEPKDAQWAQRVAQLEKHMRMNNLRQHTTVTEELGKPQDQWDEVKSTKEARRLAFDIFWNARSDYSRNYIVFEDLLHFLPADKALAALKVLDGDHNGKVYPSEMRDAVLNIYKERKYLAATLSDTHSVVGKMETTFAAIIHTILVVFYLTIFEVNVQQVWLSLSSSLLAFVFIFGNSIRNLYESSLLLFVIHPFDVGDVCFLDKDQWCQVVEISLQVTTFQRWDGIRIYYPNAKLSSEPILNVSRSAYRWEGYKILVDINTPAEVFEKVDAAVAAMFAANSADFTGEKLVCANGASDPLKFTLCVFWEYKHVGTELLKLAEARHKLYMTVSKALAEAGARYHLPPYEGMESFMMHMGLRPAEEGSAFMPTYLRKGALKL